MRTLESILQESAAHHRHLCPRQILGARMVLFVSKLLTVDLPRKDKRLLVISETDGCFVDGVIAATGCTVGHRTLRVEDYGKVAVTFVDTKKGRAVRLAPALDVREKAIEYAPNELRHYFAQIKAYKIMPDEEMFTIQEVKLNTPVDKIISRPGVRVNCSMCGEEVINEREMMRNGSALCQSCAGSGYYRSNSLLMCGFSALTASDYEA